jgi:glycosyltransferase involved in cell wall biosynthesis
MKVAFVTHFPTDPGKPHGGVEAVVVNLLRGFKKLPDVDLDVVVLDNNVSEPQIHDWDGINIHRLPRTTESELVNAITTGRETVKKYLYELAPDIVHAHDTYGFMIQNMELPRVFTIHGFINRDTYLSKSKFSYLRSLLWKFYEEKMWAEQPNIISISPYVRERISGINQGMVYDIDNPIGSSFFDIERNTTGNIIFSAAHINIRKNTLKLIQAVNLLVKKGVEVELRLAGLFTDSNYKKEILDYIEENGIQDNIKLLGVIGTSEIKNELAKASIFALVSLEENSPMGIEEAMAVGLPVVTSNRCGMPYMVQHGESGYLVDPYDPQNIAEKLELILTSNDRFTRMCTRSREIAEERFHVDRVVKKTMRVYKEILNKS